MSTSGTSGMLEFHETPVRRAGTVLRNRLPARTGMARRNGLDPNARGRRGAHRDARVLHPRTLAATVAAMDRAMGRAGRRRRRVGARFDVVSLADLDQARRAAILGRSRALR